MKGIIRRNYLNRLIILSAGVMALFCLTQCGSSTKVQNKMEASSVNGYPEFEDGMTWIFEDGQAKVKTFDGVEASMKASDVPGYLKSTRTSVPPACRSATCIPSPLMMSCRLPKSLML